MVLYNSEIEYSNENIAKILGYPRIEMEGKTTIDFAITYEKDTIKSISGTIFLQVKTMAKLNFG